MWPFVIDEIKIASAVIEPESGRDMLQFQIDYLATLRIKAPRVVRSALLNNLQH